jgi:hypothetical protein
MMILSKMVLKGTILRIVVEGNIFFMLNFMI